MGDTSEQELYARFSRHVVHEDRLDSYGYPRQDPYVPGSRKAPLGQALRAELAPSYDCKHCSKRYYVNQDGMPQMNGDWCVFHPGHWWDITSQFSCCGGRRSSSGCSSSEYHVHEGDYELVHYKGYVETQPKPERDPDQHGVYGLDGEVCFTTHGLELTRIILVDHKLDVVYEKLVKPEHPILDYNTKYSGITKGDLDGVTTVLADVQQDLLQLFSSKTILVGHDLSHNMKALKIFHKRFVDTVQLFPHRRRLPFKKSLKTLMKEKLGVTIQEGCYDPREDVRAAFKLVVWYAGKGMPY